MGVLKSIVGSFSSTFRRLSVLGYTTTKTLVKRGLGWVATVLLAVVCTVVLSQTLPAGLPYHLRNFQVEIAGVDYGVFDRIGGIERVNVAGGEQGYFEVTLERHFVAHPSLSFWAKRQRARHTRASDIVLSVQVEGNGPRYLLKYCQPLSWSVEAANTASGGYHETVVLAVQDISYR